MRCICYNWDNYHKSTTADITFFMLCKFESITALITDDFNLNFPLLSCALCVTRFVHNLKFKTLWPIKKIPCLAGNYTKQSDVNGFSQMTASIYRKFDMT